MTTINPIACLIAFLRACECDVQYIDQYPAYDEREKEYSRFEPHPSVESQILLEEYLKRHPRVLRELVWTVHRLSEMFPQKRILVQSYPGYHDGPNPEKGRYIVVGFESKTLSPEQLNLFTGNDKLWKAIHVRSGRKLKVQLQARMAEARQT